MDIDIKTSNTGNFTDRRFSRYFLLPNPNLYFLVCGIGCESVFPHLSHNTLSPSNFIVIKGFILQDRDTKVDRISLTNSW